MEKLLVSTAELAEHLDDPDWIVFDTRHDLMDPAKGARLYAEGHIPGAYFLGVDDDLAGRKTGTNGRHPLPDLQEFAARLNERGVTPEKQVVVYDDMSGNFAVRLWWMLRWLGHERVALLDGGFPLWVKEGRPVTTEVPQPRPGAFVPRPHLGSTVDVHFVERFRSDPSIKLVDARAAERFAGLQEPIDPVAGHIPGARNAPWNEPLPDVPGGKIVAYCGSGITACVLVHRLALAGRDVKLYPGSWSEWSGRGLTAERGEG
jgi:thiosulfate/3-mercaptopyruvate sulfurtransferase